jgi:hypothetical protein
VAIVVPPSSARASASSWFTVWVARTLAAPICRSDCLSSSVIGAFALRQVGLHAQSGQRRLELVCGVGQKALLVAIECLSRRSRSLTDDTSGATSCGIERSSSGLRSSGRRADALLQPVERLDGIAPAHPDQQARPVAGSRTAAASRP